MSRKTYSAPTFAEVYLGVLGVLESAFFARNTFRSFFYVLKNFCAKAEKPGKQSTPSTPSTPKQGVL